MCYIGVIFGGVYWDTGKYNGNYYLGIIGLNHIFL